MNMGVLPPEILERIAAVEADFSGVGGEESHVTLRKKCDVIVTSRGRGPK